MHSTLGRCWVECSRRALDAALRLAWHHPHLGAGQQATLPGPSPLARAPASPPRPCSARSLFVLDRDKGRAFHTGRLNEGSGDFCGCTAQTHEPRQWKLAPLVWKRWASPDPRTPPFPLGPPTAFSCSAPSQNRLHLSNEPVWPSGGVMPVKAALLEMPYSLPLFYYSTRAFCGLH